MCGIDGFISRSNKVKVSNRYYAAHSLLSHRGPDDEGFLSVVEDSVEFFSGDRTVEFFRNRKSIQSVVSSKVVMGHSRLSIIDLSSNGHQPMTDESERYYLVYNGELYNYKEIREELISLGESFVSESDTEVVLKSLRRWGGDAFNKFNGMWALAFYDNKEKSLMLSRDRFGIKPLYYFYDGDTLFFASEIKFIKSFVEKKFVMNANNAIQYLDKCLLNWNSDTFWEGIRELAPGCWLMFNENSFSIEKYWTFKPIEQKRTLEDAVEEFADIFRNAVKLRMRSDVEVGASLSGGLDSNLIVAELFSQNIARKNEFKTFSIVFDEEKFSEKKYIDETVKRFDLDAKYIYPNIEELTQDIDTMMYHLEEPFRSLSTYSLFLIYKYVKNKTNVKVILNGQGADEAFAGYTSHYFMKFASLFKELRFNNLNKEMQLFIKNRGYNWNSTTIYTLFHLVQMLCHRSNFNEESFKGITQASLREYLRYDDRLSMAFGIESRAAFMDYRLIEFAFSLGHELKIKQFENKIVPREYAKSIIPTAILNRKDKMGFISPQELWQKNQLKKYTKQNIEELKGSINKGILSEDFAKYRVKNLEKMQWNDAWRMVCFNRWLKVNKFY